MGPQILGLIDDQDDGAAFGILLEEKRVKIIQEVRVAGCGCGNTEFPVYGLKKFGRPKTGIENQRRTMAVGIKLAQESP
jgi:hypothetical protein